MGLLDGDYVSSVPMPFIISPGMLGRPLVAGDQNDTRLGVSNQEKVGDSGPNGLCSP